MRRNKSREEFADRFDPSKATQEECEFMAPIISGEKRAFSLPDVLNVVDILTSSKDEMEFHRL